MSHSCKPNLSCTWPNCKSLGCSSLHTYCYTHWLASKQGHIVEVETPSRNPIYSEILSKMKTLHENKSHDYAQDSNVFSNFEIAGNLASHFKDGTDRAFVVLIGVKIARLSELLSGKTPKNESIEDTFIDLANYCAIWGSYRIKRARIVEDCVERHTK